MFLHWKKLEIHLVSKTPTPSVYISLLVNLRVSIWHLVSTSEVRWKTGIDWMQWPTCTKAMWNVNRPLWDTRFPSRNSSFLVLFTIHAKLSRTLNWTSHIKQVTIISVWRTFVYRLCSWDLFWFFGCPLPSLKTLVSANALKSS